MSDKPNTLTLAIDLAKDAYVSKTEQAKADKEGRKPVAQALGSSGGFIKMKDDSGRMVRVSYNVLTA